MPPPRCAFFVRLSQLLMLRRQNTIIICYLSQTEILLTVTVDRNFFCKVTDHVYAGLVDNAGKRWVVKVAEPTVLAPARRLPQAYSPCPQFNRSGALSSAVCLVLTLAHSGDDLSCFLSYAAACRAVTEEPEVGGGNSDCLAYVHARARAPPQIAVVRLASGNRELVPVGSHKTVLVCSACRVGRITTQPPSFASVPVALPQRIDVSHGHAFRVMGMALHEHKARVGDEWMVALRLPNYGPDFATLSGGDVYAFHVTIGDCETAAPKGKEEYATTADFEVVNTAQFSGMAFPPLAAVAGSGATPEEGDQSSEELVDWRPVTLDDVEMTVEALAGSIKKLDQAHRGEGAMRARVRERARR